MIIDYSNIETTQAPPEASSMIETFRAIGYSIETAVADIIDNSITANAHNIWIDYERFLPTKALARIFWGGDSRPLLRADPRPILHNIV